MMRQANSTTDQFLEHVEPSRAYRISSRTFPVLTDPAFVVAADAHFMRPDDWIVGVRVGEIARCYPAFMLDNYHVVNDTIDGRPFAIMHCEICCSDAVYLAEHDGRRLTYGTGGLYGGTLSVYDEQTQSLWSHGMGVAFDGPLRGVGLVRTQSFQASFAEWYAQFSETEVMVWPSPASHPDARHGHGTDATFALPGIEPLVLNTMTACDDPRLPENEMVLTIFATGGIAALPLRELYRAGGLVTSQVGRDTVVTLGAGPGSALTGTFRPCLDDGAGEPVDLAVESGRIVDRRTRSQFRVDGLATGGALTGRRLRPVPTMTNKWHSLASFLPNVAILHSDGPRCSVAERGLAPAMDSLRAQGVDVVTRHELFDLELPYGASEGVRVSIQGDAFDAILFRDETLAQDELLWRSRATVSGRLLLVSTPQRFADATNTRLLRDEDVAWSALTGDQDFQAILVRASDELSKADLADDCSMNITQAIARLRANGVRIVVCRGCYRETLPVDALSGAHAEIEGDPYIVYRFADESAARHRNPDASHSVVLDNFVLRSDPADIYQDQARETLRRTDDRISWSHLLDTGRLEQAWAAASGECE